MAEKVPYNPYGNKDGTPKDGKEAEFFEYARQKELERRKSLTEEEVKLIEESENALARRMNS